MDVVISVDIQIHKANIRLYKINPNVIIIAFYFIWYPFAFMLFLVG